jgi:hypothetical protein
MKPLDWSDPAARRAWLELLRVKVVDLVAVAEDAAKPRLERFFSRAEQRRRIAELERGLLALLDEAAGTLRPVAVVPPERSSGAGEGEEGPPSTLRPV